MACPCSEAIHGMGLQCLGKSSGGGDQTLEGRLESWKVVMKRRIFGPKIDRATECCDGADLADDRGLFGFSSIYRERPEN